MKNVHAFSGYTTKFLFWPRSLTMRLSCVTVITCEHGVQEPIHERKIALVEVHTMNCNRVMQSFGCFPLT